ncbi:hypothetical protein GCM10011583_70560 [Streptomyces camponoticapitis]|uniref:Uncharacterized protein n=1 Tax=Streptomyces camponoticapitis TaxID=1616125 RepID=A0ABQ2EYJ2_9ACTN|nr:hypothetical protein GCM10011583_70560 [Streptomyces camponoticapitis]
MASKPDSRTVSANSMRDPAAALDADTRKTCSAYSPGECFFPCSQQDSRQALSLQVRSTPRIFDLASDPVPSESTS